MMPTRLEPTTSSSQEEAPLLADAATPASEPPAHRPIQRLEEHVVNRIAAGEIIQRPANALKELIENSLDAGASLIRVTLRDGGLKMLQIQDNGSGVRRSDMPLLCERFATSKLRDFSDLSSMQTFGFRGEALASISYVSASMNVVSKTRQDACAYRAYYSQGQLAPPKVGQSSEPKPCAGTDGTTITVEDLFFNVPQRRRALRSAAEEYNRALEVASRYAVHYGGRGVGFICKKAGSNLADLSTAASSTQTTLDTIRQLHGSAVARELVRLDPAPAGGRDADLGFRVQGWLSGANWSARRTTFLCFINNRLVECAPLKRSLEALYSALLPRGGHPWMYLSLDIEPDRVDVNVHPTKREVRFLDEEDIVERICNHAQECLAGANSSRTFTFTQALLPGAPEPTTRSTSTTLGKRAFAPDATHAKEARGDSSDAADAAVTTATTSMRSAGPKAVDPRKLVRTDARARTLDSMLHAGRGVDGAVGGGGVGRQAERTERSARVPPSQLRDGDSATEADDARGAGGAAGSADPEECETDAATASSAPAATTRGGRGKIAETKCTLTSVRQLRKAVVRERHVGLTDILQNHTFVGVVDVHLGLSLVQHSTRLYLVRHVPLVRELAYQLVLRQFGGLARTRLEPPAELEALVRLGLEDLPERSRGGSKDDEEVQRITDTLVSRSEMLAEYFSIGIEAGTKTLNTLPALLPGRACVPLDSVPRFVYRLGAEVDWDEETACLRDVARQLAALHVPPLGAYGGGGTVAKHRRRKRGSQGGRRRQRPRRGDAALFADVGGGDVEGRKGEEEDDGACNDDGRPREAHGAPKQRRKGNESQDDDGDEEEGDEPEEEEDDDGDDEGDEEKEDEEELAAAEAKEKWEVQHLWFASMGAQRGGFLPPKRLVDAASLGESSAAVLQVANLPDLYRVFERC